MGIWITPWSKQVLSLTALLTSLLLLTGPCLADATTAISEDSTQESLKPLSPASDTETSTTRQIADSTPAQSAETGANQERFPKQILKTGVNLQASYISPNSRQLAEQLHLLPLLQRIQTARERGIDPTNFTPTTENIAISQQMTASTVMPCK